MFKRSHYIALGLVLVLTLVIINLPSRTTARMKLTIGSTFLPLFGLANASQDLAGKTGDALLPRSDLIRQLDNLRRENQQLRLQVREAEEATRENARLRQLFGWQQRTRKKLKLANVVLRDPANWWRTVRIDLGSRHGVTNNLPVLTGDGYLVGRIDSVSLNSSQVVLIGDPHCKVAALIENESRDTGVVGGSGPLEGSLVEMSKLSRNANIKPGQNVVTSGLGGIFPKDLFIGTVVDTHLVEYGLFSVARVKLAANLGALEEVWVLFPQ
jgi:rod shape-determining protein MreC